LKEADSKVYAGQQAGIDLGECGDSEEERFDSKRCR
jgi:hypothetical protein